MLRRTSSSKNIEVRKDTPPEWWATVMSAFERTGNLPKAIAETVGTRFSEPIKLRGGPEVNKRPPKTPVLRVRRWGGPDDDKEFSRDEDLSSYNYVEVYSGPELGWRVAPAEQVRRRLRDEAVRNAFITGGGF